MIIELLEDSGGRDAELLEELNSIVRWLRIAVDRYEMTKLLSRPYDKKGARLTISAGAGGTDAQVCCSFHFSFLLSSLDKLWTSTNTGDLLN